MTIPRRLRTYLEREVGEGAAELFGLLERGEATAYDLSEQTGIEIVEVRRILNHLYDLGLVAYRKEGKTKLQRSYFWRLKPSSLESLQEKLREEELYWLRDRLEFEEENVFYFCPQDQTRLTFDDAFEKEFRCPHCRGILLFEERNPSVEALRGRIQSLSGAEA
jgi:transcription initiation factor TFIIE subunit alpha